MKRLQKLAQDSLDNFLEDVNQQYLMDVCPTSRLYPHGFRDMKYDWDENSTIQENLDVFNQMAKEYDRIYNDAQDKDIYIDNIDKFIQKEMKDLKIPHDNLFNFKEMKYKDCLFDDL